MSTLSGPSQVSDYFRPVERGLRLDRDLERLWWKLFIHVNSDLSEISQEQLWLLDTSASRKDEGSESEEAEEFRL